jgi:hypothetical protein
MPFDSTITVTRLRPVPEPMDLAPIFARFPAAHPEEITAVEAQQLTLDEASVKITYANEVAVIGHVNWVDGEWSVGARPIHRSIDPWGITPDRPLLDAITALIGEIGRGLLDPAWLESEPTPCPST